MLSHVSWALAQISCSHKHVVKVGFGLRAHHEIFLCKCLYILIIFSCLHCQLFYQTNIWWSWWWLFSRYQNQDQHYFLSLRCFETKTPVSRTTSLMITDISPVKDDVLLLFLYLDVEVAVTAAAAEWDLVATLEPGIIIWFHTSLSHYVLLVS